jgi:putative transposase
VEPQTGVSHLLRSSFRRFNVIDDFNREGLVIDIAPLLPAERVVRALNQVIVWRGKPSGIRRDNGPSCTAFDSIISSPAGRSRTPISNATTGRCATTGSAITCSSLLKRCGIMQPTRRGLTITNAPTWRSVALPLNRS